MELLLSQPLTITELYVSVQGESSWAGLPCAFIRLTGCPLRCRWCDTVYSFHGGQKMSIAEILEKLKGFGVPLVELTGGEPLAQEGAIPLMRELLAQGYRVMIETSGALPISDVPKEVIKIVDLKCPDSGMCDKNLMENIEHLSPHDEIKFVVASRQDFEWAKEQIRSRGLDKICTQLLSPAWGLVTPKDLVEWMLEAKVPARLNLQQHKYIWSPRQKGV